MKRRRYTDAQLAEAVRTSANFRQVLARLGLVQAGGNYSTVQRLAREQGLDTSHMTGQGWRKGYTQPIVPARPLEELLQQGTTIMSHKLKLRLFAAGLKDRRCESCGGVEWLGHHMPLELDHINGDNCDNRIENLRVLCPNYHALTSTYRGKKLAKCRDETAPS